MSEFIAYYTDGPKPYAPLTRERYKTAFKLFARFLDDRKNGLALVTDLSKAMLEDFYAWLKDGRTAYTKERYVQRVQTFWEWLDNHDDKKYANVPRPRYLEMESEPAEAVVAPTWEEMSLCIDACLTEWVRRITTILYFTGVRAEQARTMEWSQVDVERGVMTIKPHKALPGRIIPMSPHFAAELAKWGKREGFLCGYDVSDSLVRKRVREAWERAAVRREAWDGQTQQAFRIGVTTGLKLAGINKEDAELYLGRTVEGARKSYLAVGMLPLEHVAQAIPAVGKSNVVAMKAKEEA
jgi:integrase